MDYLIGISLAVAACGVAALVGFDRERGFYPIMLIVISTYYVLFAVTGGDSEALLDESLIAVAFVGAAVTGFRSSLWIVVAALAGHGIFDFAHHQFVRNDGVPVWWPGFCLGFDIVAALCLGALLLKRSELDADKGVGKQGP
ncbi:MAG TPA: hypothetical protein VGU61_21920 [Noviherbaspirillum sp.]|jgi:hypothetical protein|uniref:hypothetical protein n=1 Tax=Noviherbaspirillum sp. TaxID=1926288 RepID=UPI002DDD0FE7|nr:hypothetical protein [Noviherbaspirillum sp.]HEV2612933.1 hypothetical protein [Noviherbaspirillum sp.]